MSDEVIMAKVNSFMEELRELGVEDFVFAAGGSNGTLAIQYNGNSRGVAFLAMSALMNAMFDSLEGEVTYGGREDYGE